MSYGIIKGQLTRKIQFFLILPCCGEDTRSWTATKELVQIHDPRADWFVPAFFLRNEYVRAQGLPGLADGGKVGGVYRDIHELAERHIGVASGQLDADALLVAKDTDS